MKHGDRCTWLGMVVGLLGLSLLGWLSIVFAAEPPIDFQRARQFLQKERSGGT